MAFVQAAGEAKNRGWIQRPNSQAENADSDPCDIKDDGPGTTSPHPYNLGPNWEDRGVIQSQQFPSSSRFWMVDINKDRKAEFVAVDKDQNFRFWWNGGPSGANWVPFVEGQKLDYCLIPRGGICQPANGRGRCSRTARGSSPDVSGDVLVASCAATWPAGR
ncbi:hypothetical protein SAMN05421505_1346 [Sinosporangium album]|uniref:Repeat domain-containing protein n=1 Tax=Sinosporangium album TaxID=504805 RepID=A0A1G8HTV9_9ACTN|nr:hypothetical protein [Sinosporangium album]SDI10096.1 hypothetical protein SAMN05421505_1346 [Sinosporangium album]